MRKIFRVLAGLFFSAVLFSAPPVRAQAPPGEAAVHHSGWHSSQTILTIYYDPSCSLTFYVNECFMFC